jgi:death-on-curing family protein
MKNQITIYKGKGTPEVAVKLVGDEVWLNRNQIATLFNRDVKTIGKHINNALSEELRDFSTVAHFATVQNEGGRKVERQIEHYNLDVILSVGYRVKSAEGVRFRIWANNILKKYVKDGAVINQPRLDELDLKKLRNVESMLGVIQRLIKTQELSAGEASGVLEVITKYNNSFKLLEKYDEGKIIFATTGKKPKKSLDVDTALDMISELKSQVGNSELFGKLRGNGLDAVVGALYQSFSGRELYPTTAEKAANLLYLIIKDHPFYDGNKRIGAFLFIIFLTINDYHLTKDGTTKISDRALVALALLIAESNPSEKSLLIALICKLLEN